MKGVILELSFMAIFSVQKKLPIACWLGLICQNEYALASVTASMLLMTTENAANKLMG